MASFSDLVGLVVAPDRFELLCRPREAHLALVFYSAPRSFPLRAVCAATGAPRVSNPPTATPKQHISDRCSTCFKPIPATPLSENMRLGRELLSRLLSR